MGFIEEFVGPAADKFSTLSTGLQIGLGLGGFVFVSVLVNVLNQILFKNPNEPPMVFHWFPLIGSTVTYGIDPPRWMKVQREKVSSATGHAKPKHGPFSY